MMRSLRCLAATFASFAIVAGCAGSPDPVGSLETSRSPSAVPSSSAGASPMSSPGSPSPPPASPPSAWAGGWHPAAPMLGSRIAFDAVRLGDGRVLVVGDEMCVPGGATPGSERTEVYEPDHDRWTEVGSLNKPRDYFATIVTAAGEAFVIGGVNAEDVPFSSTKLFALDAEDAWTDGPLLDRARVHPLAVTLPDGSIVALSGVGGRTTMERLGPTMDAWRPGAAVPRDIELYGIVPLPDGRVLAVGVDYDPQASDPSIVTLIYDLDRDRWHSVESPPSGAIGTLVAVDDGALSIGGYPLLASDEDPLGGRHVEQFDVASETWHPLAPMQVARDTPQLAARSDGSVVVAGGAVFPFAADPRARALASVEVYDPRMDRWVPGPDLLEPRYLGHMIALEDGSVLVLGGQADFNTAGDTPWCPSPIVTVERWMPDT